MQEVEVLYDLHRALRELKLPDDVIELACAGFHGIAASKIAADLGWTTKKIRHCTQTLRESEKSITRVLAIISACR
jgi:hypothetical protein